MPRLWLGGDPAQRRKRPNRIMTRILYCETNLDGTVGGSYFSLYYLVTRLDRTKYYPVVIFYYANPVSKLLSEQGIEVHIIKPGKRIGAFKLIRRTKLTGLINSISFILIPAFRFRRFLRSNSISLTHVNNGLDANYPWILAARLAGIPCVVHQRGDISDGGPLFRYFRKFVAKVICVSEAIARNAAAGKLPSSKLLTIYNGIDPDKLLIASGPLEVRERLGIPASAPLIGISGTIRSWKGQDVVLKAVKLLKETFPDIVCLIVGEVSKDQLEYEGYLHKLVDDLAISGHVRFLGHQDRVFEFVNAIDVPIHASTEPEPFGRVIIEAMALEKAVVASRAGGVTEIVVEGETGLMYTPGDAVELASCVKKLLQDPDLAKRLGKNGRARVERHFHADQTARRVMAVYQELLSS